MKKKKLKYDACIKTDKLYICNKNLHLKSNNITSINTYITYQKTIVDEKQFENIIKQGLQILHQDLRNKCKINLYYKYQQSLRSLLY